MKAKKILVTGATGMLGRELVRTWSSECDVRGVSRRGGERTAACDLSDVRQTESLFKGRHVYDLVVHTAAYSDVDGCERDPELARASNALATRTLASACGRKKIPLVYVSTDYVFDGRKSSPYLESDPVCPVNIYGMTKLEGEYHTKNLALVSAIVRTSWLFGAGNPKNFVNQIIERLKKETEVSVLADQKDCPTYVRDLAGALGKIGSRLIRLADQKPKKPVSETYHVCNHGVTTRYAMTLKIKEFLGLRKKRVLLADAQRLTGRLAIRPPYAAMSCARYDRIFRSPLRRWEAALEDYLAELKAKR